MKKAVISLCGLAGFILIAYFVKNFESLAFDAYLTSAVYPLREAALTYAFIAITYAANWQTVTLACLFILLYKLKFKPFGTLVVISAVLSSGVYLALKEVFMRARPDEALRLISEGGYSFPSGHSMTGLVFYGLIIYYINGRMKNKKTAKLITAFLILLIFLIGFSRVYLGVHYPTDVLAGFCIGAALLFFILLCKDRYNASVKKDAL